MKKTLMILLAALTLLFGTPNFVASFVQASNEVHTKFVPVPSFLTCSK